MYKVKVKTAYSSVPIFEYDFPDFVILTGINGAGKSQFLDALSNQNLTDIIEGDYNLTSRKIIPTNSLLPDVRVEQEHDPVEIMWNLYSSAKNPSSRVLRYQNTFAERMGKPSLRKVNIVAKRAEKDVDNLELKDFKEHLPLDDAYSSNELSSQQFSIIFKNYAKKQRENELNEARNQYLKKSHISYLPKDEFLARYPNPRNIINDLIRSANLEYKFNEPNDEDEESNFILKLINKNTGSEIDLQSLSSGEKVIMSLVFALYNSKLEYKFPQILLLDEPDASLHPSMAKQFLDVVENVFVREQGIKVIMTTHSPSTVALAPEEALFVINKSEPRVEKTTKDKALRILTEGVPSLSINYENRRQVFVESENDVIFYDKFYGKLRNKLVSEISLNFISSGESRTDKHGQPVSNCGQVINITNVLRTTGNKSIFGIIDWDKENKSSEFVKVLGEGSRYAIENYIFDSILVAAFLLRETFITKEDLGLKDNETYVDFKHLSEERLQAISDFVIKRLKPSEDNDGEVCIVEYVKEGIRIEVPKWYLIHNGHQLVDLLKKAFNQLCRYRNEDELKEEILRKVVDDILELIPSDVLKVFQTIQNG